MCNCKNAGVAGKRKKGRRRSSAVGGIKMQPIKGLLNVKTAAVAGGTVWGLKQVTDGATGTEMALLRSKQGAMYEAGAGLAGAFLLKNPWLRGIALGLAVDGGKKYLTGEDWNGNTLPETMDAVAGLWYPGGNPVGQFNNGVSGRVKYGR